MKVTSQHSDTALNHISAIRKLTYQTTHEECCLPSKIAPTVLKLPSKIQRCLLACSFSWHPYSVFEHELQHSFQGATQMCS